MEPTERLTTCEMLYQLRDAVLANNVNLAIYICREVHDRLLEISRLKQDLDCTLQCEIKKEL